MLLTKGCENKLGAHMAKLDAMIADLKAIIDKANEKISGASKPWKKSDAGVKFEKDLENVEWLHNQYKDMRKKISEEIKAAGSTSPVAELNAANKKLGISEYGKTKPAIIDENDDDEW